MAQSASALRRTNPRACTRRAGGLARLLAGISTGAAALAISLSPSAVRAASAGGAVNGTPTAQFGVSSISRTPTLDTVTINAKDALIDWASNDPNVYLPVARTLQFTGVNGTPYTVLNRVNGAAPLAINGTVASDGAGKVWFYNPGGWVVGSTGVFNVGSLVLSSNPVTVTAGVPDGQRLVDANGAIHFTQGLAGSSIAVLSGASITASNYVAMVSPRVVQGGTVTAGGSVAYVAGEAATLNVNSGLFDITVDTGTTDANGVVHTGTTTGSASTAAKSIYMVAVPKNQLLTMLVSGTVGYAPAITAQGQVDGSIVLGAGYNVKGGAVSTNTLAAANGSARLSALTATGTTRVAASDTITVDATGSSVVFAKDLNATAFNAISVNAAGAGHVVATGTDLTLFEFTSTPSRTIALSATGGGAINVAGRAQLLNASGPGTGAITINAATGGGLTIGGDLGASASTFIGFSVSDQGSKLQVGGSVALSATNAPLTLATGTTGGTITLGAANMAKLTIAGTLDVRADGSGGVTLDPSDSTRLLAGSIGVAATAGTIAATNANATFTVGGSASLRAIAYGGIGAVSAGAANAGAVSFAQSGAGASSSFGTAINDTLAIESRATSALELQYPPTFSATGANSSAGAATLSVGGGSFAAKNITVDSSAMTGLATDTTPYTATAGATSASFSNGNYNANNLVIFNQASDGNGGVVTAGKVSVTLTNAKLNLIGGNGYLDAETTTRGTVTTLGALTVSLTNGSSLTADGNVYLASRADSAGTGATKPADLTLNLSNSSLMTSSVSINSTGVGGGLSANGTGGLAAITLDTSSSLTTTNGGLFIQTDGVASAFGGRPVDGGIGTGGTALLAIADSIVTLAGDLSLEAGGQSGDRALATARSALGQGGIATVSLSGSTAALNTTNITVATPGQPYFNEGPSAQVGGGTTGIGGTSQLSVTNGATAKTGALKLVATGLGSNAFNAMGAPAAKGGSGTGGAATIALDSSGGTITAQTVSVDSSGYGGAGAATDATLGLAAGNGGIGRGGQSIVNVNGGTLSTNSLVLTSGGNVTVGRGNSLTYYGVGGTAGDQSTAVAGVGGAGFGGTSNLNINGGALADMPDPSTGAQVALAVNVSALGQGGRGGPTFSGDGPSSTQGAGGFGTGGSAQLNYDAGAFDPQSVAVDASGLGGNGGIELSSSTPLAVAGAGGNALGGNATFEVSAGLSANTSGGATRTIAVTANATGANGESSVSGGAGGSAVGGTASFATQGGATIVASVRVSAAGKGGVGGDSQVGNAGGSGGSGQGGTGQITTNGGSSANLSNYNVSAAGTGGNGGAGGNGSTGSSVAGNGGIGGAAGSGTVLVEADNQSVLTLVESDTGKLVADAVGGTGGRGGNASVYGSSARGNGGAGGAASGKSIQFIANAGSTIDLGDASYAVTATAGAGGGLATGNGNPSQSALGGVGGVARGGSIQLNASNPNSAIVATALTLTASAIGGNGAAGSGTNATSGNGTPGVVGGDASGGGIIVQASDGGAITVSATGGLSLSTIATGGLGGNGSNGLAGTGGAGGRGGDGGAGIGGTISLLTGTNAAIALPTNNVSNLLAATGNGSAGGNGGNGASSVATSGAGGNGGDGGVSGGGQGGQISITANGGTITSGDLTLGANGSTTFGYSAGLGGTGGAGAPGQTIPNENPLLPPTVIPPGPNGNSGNFFSANGPSGGQSAITAADDGNGQFGTITLGNIEANVTSQLLDPSGSNTQANGAGLVSLTDTTNMAGTGLYAQSLTIDASGSYATSSPAVTLLSDFHPVTVTNSVTVNAEGLILFTGQDGGGLVAGGAIQLTSNQDTIDIQNVNAGKFSAPSINLSAAGNIQLIAQNCPASSCVVAHADGAFLATSLFNQVILSGRAKVEGLGSISITAGSNILGDPGSGYVSNGDVMLFGGGDVQVRNVSARSLMVNAGSQGGASFNPAALTVGEDDGSGSIDTNASQTYASGGSITVPGGNSLSAGSGIAFTSGNNIVVGKFASIAANQIASDGPASVNFAAGAIVPQTTMAAGDIASLLIGSGAMIDAAGGDISLTGGAIDARGASLTGRSFTADVTNSLTLASPRSNDGGALTVGCLEADICLGGVKATGPVRIGTSETTPLHFLGVDAISGSDVHVVTQGALTVGTNAQLATVTAKGRLQLSSRQGDVAVVNGTQLTGSNIDINAGGSLLGTGVITATGDDIGISVGKSIVANTLNAARQLTASGQTGGAIEPKFVTPGDFTVTTLKQVTDIDITAGGNIAVGLVSVSGNSVSLNATSMTSLLATQGVANLILTGNTANYGTIGATGFITVTGTNGVTGTSANASAAFSASGSSIVIGPVASGTDTTLVGGTMTLTTIDATGNLSITAGGQVLLGRGNAKKAITIAASSLTAPALTSGGAMTLTSTGVSTLGSVTAGTDLTVNAGTLKFTTLNSTSGATAIFGGVINGGTIVAGSAIGVKSTGAIALTSANSGTTLALAGTTITVPALTSGGAMTLASTGASTLGTVTIGGGLQANAAPLSYGTINAVGPIAISATSVSGGAATSKTSSLSITSPGAVNVGALASGTDIAVSGNPLTLTTIDAGGNLTLASAGAVSLTRGNAVQAIAITANSLAVPALTSGGNTTLNVTNVARLGTVKAGGNILIDPTVVSFMSMTSAGSTAITAGDVFGGTIDAGMGISIKATGEVVLDRANAGTTLALSGTTITAPSLTSGGGTMLTSSGASTLGTATAGSDLTVNAGTLRFTVLNSTSGATTIAGGDINGGTIAAGSAIGVKSTGAIALTSASSGTTLALAGTTITAPALTSGGAMTLASTDVSTLGAVTSGGGLQADAAPLSYGTISAVGPVAISATTVSGGAVTSKSGSVAITSPGAVNVGAVTSGTDTTIAALTLTFPSIAAGGSATLTANSVNGNSISAGQDVSATSGTALAFQTVSAGRNATLIAQTGNVTVSTDLAVGGAASAAGGAVSLTSKGPLSIATVVARGGDIGVVAGGALNVSDGEAIGNITLTSQTGSFAAGTLAAGYTPTATFGNAKVGIGTQQVGPGNIALNAASGITITGKADAAAALIGTTGGAITANGLVTANTIVLTSADLAISSTGQIGQARATSVVLTNGGSGAMVLGDGFDAAGTYVINNAEFARIYSGGNLTIDGGATTTSTAAQLTIGTLAASAASGTTEGNVGATGTLRLVAGGNVAVLGAATFANAAGNTLALNATGDLMVDAARGSFRLIEGTGRGGTLVITAPRVFAVTPQAQTSILGSTSTAAITSRLSLNDGVTGSPTLLEAGTLLVHVSSGFYVQNTAPLATFDARRGLVADSLTITNTNPMSANTNTNPATTTQTAITVVINGLVNGLSGLSTVPIVQIVGASDIQSSVNGCVILAVTTCNKPVTFDNPIKDVITQVIGNQTAEASTIPLIGDGFFNAPLTQIHQIAPAGFAPVIDEPVTGTGNDDLVGEWISAEPKAPLKKKKVAPRARAHAANGN